MARAIVAISARLSIATADDNEFTLGRFRLKRPCDSANSAGSASHVLAERTVCDVACPGRITAMLTRRAFLYQTTGTLAAIAGASTALAQKSGTQVFYDRSVLLHQPPADHP